MLLVFELVLVLLEKVHQELCELLDLLRVLRHRYIDWQLTFFAFEIMIDFQLVDESLMQFQDYLLHVLDSEHVDVN